MPAQVVAPLETMESWEEETQLLARNRLVISLRLCRTAKLDLAKAAQSGGSKKPGARRKTMRSRRCRQGGDVRREWGEGKKEDVNGESKSEGMKGEMSRSGVRRGKLGNIIKRIWKRKEPVKVFFLLAAAWVCPGRSALQSAKHWCYGRNGHNQKLMRFIKQNNKKAGKPSTETFLIAIRKRALVKTRR